MKDKDTKPTISFIIIASAIRTFSEFQNFISTAHVRDDVMRFECKRSSEKY